VLLACATGTDLSAGADAAWGSPKAATASRAEPVRSPSAFEIPTKRIELPRFELRKVKNRIAFRGLQTVRNSTRSKSTQDRIVAVAGDLITLCRKQLIRNIRPFISAAI
jgi:hypothetical protein